MEAFGEGAQSALASVSASSVTINSAIGNCAPFGQTDPSFQQAEQIMATFESAAQIYTGVMALIGSVDAYYGQETEAADYYLKAFGYLEEAGLDYLKCEANRACDLSSVSGLASNSPQLGGYVRTQMGGSTSCPTSFNSTPSDGCNYLQMLVNRTDVGKILSDVQTFQKNFDNLKHPQIRRMNTARSSAGNGGMTLKKADIIARPALNVISMLPMGCIASAASYLESVLNYAEGSGIIEMGDMALAISHDFNKLKDVGGFPQLLKQAQKNVQTLSDAVPRLGNNLESLGSSIQSLGNGANTAISGLGPQINATSSLLSTLGHDADAYSQSPTTSNLRTLDTDIKKLSASLNSDIKLINDINTPLKQTTDKLTNISRGLQSIPNAVGGLGANVDTLGDDLYAMYDMVSAIEEAADSTDTSMSDALYDAYSTVSDVGDSLTGVAKQIYSPVQTVNSYVASVTGPAQQVSQTLNSASAQVLAIRLQMDNLSKDLDTWLAAMDSTAQGPSADVNTSVNSRTATIKANLGSVPASLSAVQSALSALTSALGSGSQVKGLGLGNVNVESGLIGNLTNGSNMSLFSSMPQLGNTDFNSFSSKPIHTSLGDINIPVMPFMQSSGGGPAGGRGAVAPDMMLKGMDPAPGLSIAYPPSGKVVGISTDSMSVDVLGQATDYLPHLVKISAQADNGPIITTAIDLHTIYTADKDNSAGGGLWHLKVPVPHGGLNTIKVWAENAAAFTTTLSFPVYAVGSQFPEEGSVVRPVTSIKWVAQNSGWFTGITTVAQGVARVSFIGTAAGDAPSTAISFNAGATNLLVQYPDGSPNPDFMAINSSGAALPETSPGAFTLGSSDAGVTLKLKSVYRGKAFINIAGNVDSSALAEYKMQYVDGWIDTLEAQAHATPLNGAEAFGNGNTCVASAEDFIRPDRLILDSSQAVPGPVFRYVTSWDAWSNRLAGRYTIRTVMTDNNPGDMLSLDHSLQAAPDRSSVTATVDEVHPYGERDRAHFIIGTPLDNTSAGAGGIIVPDPYDKVEALFVPGLVAQSTNLVLYADDQVQVSGLGDTTYASFAPVYDFFPHLSGTAFTSNDDTDPNGSVKLTFKYTKDDLTHFDPFQGHCDPSADTTVVSGVRAQRLEENLGIYHMVTGNDGTNTFTPLNTQPMQGAYQVFTRTHDLSGRFMLMPCSVTPLVDPYAACAPFIFSPEGTNGIEGRPTTSLNFQVFSPTSNMIRCEVKVYDESNTTTPVAVLLDDINQGHKTADMFYVGDNGSPFVYKNVNYYFHTLGPNGGFLSVPWDGKYKGVGGAQEGKYVDDGVYLMVLRVRDAVGAITVAQASVIKGKVVPVITQLNADAVTSLNWGAPINPIAGSSGLTFNAATDGAAVSITGRAVYPAPEGFGFDGYRVGYITSTASATDKADLTKWTWLHMPDKPQAFYNPATPTVGLQQINGGELADLPIAQMPNGVYDILLAINGTRIISTPDGVTVTDGLVDTAAVPQVTIANAPGIYGLMGQPSPFNQSLSITASVVPPVGSTGQLLFTLTGGDIDTAAYPQGITLAAAQDFPSSLSWSAGVSLPGTGTQVYTVRADYTGLQSVTTTVTRITDNSDLNVSITSMTDVFCTSDDMVFLSGYVWAQSPDVLDHWNLEYSTPGTAWQPIIMGSQREVSPTADLRDLDGADLPVGEIDVRLTVYDTAGNSAQATTYFHKSFVAEVQVNPPVLMLVNGQPQSPVTLTYSLPEAASWIDISIVNSQTNQDMLHITNAPTGIGQNSIEWDGLTVGNGLPDVGPYYVSLTAAPASNTATSASITLPLMIAKLASGPVAGTVANLVTPDSIIPRPYAQFSALGTGEYSNNAGASWSLVKGGPSNMVTPHASLGSDGNLWIVYGSGGYGPSGISSGQIWKLNTATITNSSPTWSNVTPSNGPCSTCGGYGGVSVDAKNPQHALVSTLDWWYPGDEILSTSSGGSSWAAIAGGSGTSASSACTYNDNGAGWAEGCPAVAGVGGVGWAACVAIDPFNGSNAVYPSSGNAPGGGMWSTTNVQTSPVNWTFTDHGIEEMVPIYMPPAAEGGIFFSCMGDVGGMRHTSVTQSPVSMYCNPQFSNTNCLDFAESNPNIVVRAGNANATTSSDVAYSTNNGQSWTPWGSAPSDYTANNNMGSVAVAADGSRVVVAPYSGKGTPAYASSLGGSWTTCTGLPSGAYVAADRSNASIFYATSPANWVYGGNVTIYESTNGGASFSSVNTIPVSWSDANGNGQWVIPRPVFGQSGEFWVSTYNALFRFTNGGSSVATISNVYEPMGPVGFGKAASGQTHPAVYLVGTVNGTFGFWRNDDGSGAAWTQIMDTNHQYGGGPGWMEGDESIYGRCYIGAGGRGIVYGDIVSGTPTSTPTPTSSRTPSPSATRSASPSATFSDTASASPTATATRTPSPSATVAQSSATSTLSATATPTSSATFSRTPSSSGTASPTGSSTCSMSLTPTPTWTSSPAGITSTETPTLSATALPSGTQTISPNPSVTPSRTGTSTASPTATSSCTPGPSATGTSSVTAGQGSTFTATCTATETGTSTLTGSATGSASATFTPTAEPSGTRTWTASSTATGTLSQSASPTLTGTPTPSATAEASATSSATAAPGGLRILRVVPVPNPQHGPDVGLYVKVQGRADGFKVRLYSQALNEVAAFTAPGGSGWVQVKGHVPSLPAGTYFVVVHGIGSGQGSTAKGVTLLWLP